MGLTVARTESARVPGAALRTETTCTFDNSYAEGGESLSVRELGLRRLIGTPTCHILNGIESEEWVAFATYSGGKLHLWSAKTGKELAKEKDASKVVVLVVAHGKP